MTKGPTRPDAVVDYTDWEQVAAFGRQVCDLVPDGSDRVRRPS